MFFVLFWNRLILVILILIYFKKYREKVRVYYWVMKVEDYLVFIRSLVELKVD